MKTENEIYNNISNEVKDIEEKIKKLEMYNVKAFFMRRVIDSVAVVHYLAPFVLASVLMSSINVTGRKPFERKTVEEHAVVSTFDTSSGYHLEAATYDYNYSDRSIEYTTGWEEKDGYYNRTIYDYEISNKVDLNDIDSILNMSKEELTELLAITNIKTITKPTLSEEDKMFMEPAVIINSFHDSEDMTYIRDETTWEVIKYALLYIIINIFAGVGLKGIERIILKKKVENKLTEIKYKYRNVSEEEFENLIALLKVKKANFDLIDENNKEISEIELAPRKVRV